MYKKENSLSFNNSLIHWTWNLFFNIEVARGAISKKEKEKNEMLILLERLYIYICVCVLFLFLLKDNIVPKTVYYNSYDKRDTRAEKYID